MHTRILPRRFKSVLLDEKMHIGMGLTPAGLKACQGMLVLLQRGEKELLFKNTSAVIHYHPCSVTAAQDASPGAKRIVSCKRLVIDDHAECCVDCCDVAMTSSQQLLKS